MAPRAAVRRAPRVACAAGALALLAGCSLVSAVRTAVDAAGEIAAVRARSNDAIARHDLATLRETWVEDVQITSGLGSAANGTREVEERIAAAFADPTFDRWVRTSEEIEVAADGSRAAEVGRWVGRWHKPDGTMVRRGRYLAHWVKRPEGWRLRAELFVALSCEGSAECAGS